MSKKVGYHASGTHNLHPSIIRSLFSPHQPCRGKLNQRLVFFFFPLGFSRNSFRCYCYYYSSRRERRRARIDCVTNFGIYKRPRAQKYVTVVVCCYDYEYLRVLRIFYSVVGSALTLLMVGNTRYSVNTSPLRRRSSVQQIRYVIRTYSNNSYTRKYLPLFACSTPLATDCADFITVNTLAFVYYFYYLRSRSLVELRINFLYSG